MVITKDNVKQLLWNYDEDLIQLSPVYMYKKSSIYKVLRELTVELSNGKIITIPKGFLTDGSSSPSLVTQIFPRLGDFTLAAIIHDYLYVEKPEGISQRDADYEMLFWSKIINRNKVDNRLRYWYVKIGGFLVWLKYVKIFPKTKKNI